VKSGAFKASASSARHLQVTNDGLWSKRRQTKTATSQNVKVKKLTKTATNWNGDILLRTRHGYTQHRRAPASSYFYYGRKWLYDAIETF